MKTRTYKYIATSLLVGLLTTVLLITSGAFIGCAAGPATESWSIPNIGTYSGPNAEWGLENWWGVERAVTEINDAGGILGKPVTITKLGTIGWSADEAVVAFTRAVVGSLIILGPTSSNDVQTGGHIAEETKVVFINPAGMPGEVVKAAPEWGICLSPDISATYVAPTVEWLGLYPDRKSLTVFYHADNEPQVVIVADLKRVLEPRGITVYDACLPLQATGVTPAVTKALSFNSDCFLNIMLPNLAAMVTDELYNRGMTDMSRMMLGSYTNGPAYWAVVEHKDMQYGAAYTNIYIESPRWNAVLDAYHAEKGADRMPGTEMTFNYDAVYLMKQAFEDLNITGDPAKLAEERVKVKDYIRNVENFEGILATYDIVDGLAQASTYLFQMKGGQQTLVSTITIEMQRECK